MAALSYILVTGEKKNSSRGELCLVGFWNRHRNLVKLLDICWSSTSVQPGESIWLIFICARSGARCHLLPHRHPAAMHHHSATLPGTGGKGQIVRKWEKRKLKVEYQFCFVLLRHKFTEGRLLLLWRTFLKTSLASTCTGSLLCFVNVTREIALWYLNKDHWNSPINLH